MLLGIIVGILALSACLIGYMLREARQIEVIEQELYLPEWPKGFDGVRLLFLSDIHRVQLPSAIQARLSEQKPDLVLLGGDITDRGVPLGRTRSTVRFLQSLAPTYFVWGNNDYRNDYRALDIMLREEGVTPLDNTSTSFENGGDRLWLVGVDDLSLQRANLQHALDVIDQSGYRLLLSHNPEIVYKLREEDQIRGVLSGHTHGGQICLPLLGAVTGLFGRRLPFVAGEYNIHPRLKLFVSRGVGTSKIPLRLLAKPEMHLFTMRSAKE